MHDHARYCMVMPMNLTLLTAERHSRIRTILAEDGRVLASQLAAAFGVSEDTVRRDLRELADAGHCQRVYGGAVPAAPFEGSLGQRRSQAMGRKSALAASLALAVQPGAVVFLDAGSTNLAIAETLSEDARLTVVTNAPAIATVLLERRGIETILLGGRVDPVSGGCIGPKALADAERIRPDIMVLGACGVDAVEGVTCHVFEEAELKSALATRSREVFVAATTDKLGTAASYAVVPPGRISTLFVEHDCPASLLAPFEAIGLNSVRAAPETPPAPPRRSRS